MRSLRLKKSSSTRKPAQRRASYESFLCPRWRERLIRRHPELTLEVPQLHPMSAESSRAVFLSYASQDAEAAQRICQALRAADVEVWLDQSELAGGDAWDAKIRNQIASCALFVPVISASTQARPEGYFRLEWKLAAQRTHMISERTAFLLPVVIDATRDADADVPTEFRSVQWTKLPGGETSPAFVSRVQI